MPIPVPATAKAVTALVKPITKLMDIVSEGCGRLWTPAGIILQAYAEGASEIIKTKAQIGVEDLQRRAAARWLHLETQRQRNIESIVEKSQKSLPETVSDESVSKDWITQFFAAAQEISEDEMQQLWARILVSEVSQPGSISKRTLEFLKTMDSVEAATFSEVIATSMQAPSGSHYYFQFDFINDLLAERNVTVSAKQNLINIGLINALPGFAEPAEVDGWKCTYNLKQYGLLFRADSAINKALLPIPIRQLTDVGNQLARLVEIVPFPTLIREVANIFAKKYQVEFFEA